MPFLFILATVLDLEQGIPFMLGQLLKLNIRDFKVVQMFVQKDIEIGLGCYELLFAHEGHELVVDRQGRVMFIIFLLEVEKTEVISAAHLIQTNI